MNQVLNLSRNTGHIKLTGLDLWTPTFPQLRRTFTEPKIDHDKLNAGWYLRGAGLFDGITVPKRGNDTVSNTASLLILDGDSRIDVNGNIVAGAPNPLHVHLVLNFLNIDHFIYTSHSNDVGLNKYRVLIPVEYTREQLPALLEWIFARLHENDVMLTNVKENSTWAQAWFMPCVPAERAHLFKTWWRVGGKTLDKTDVSEWFEPAEPFDVERIYSEWLAKQPQQSTVKKTVAPIERPRLTTNQCTGLVTTNPIAAFNKAFTVYQILARNGFKQEKDRFIDPNSESGVAGITIVGNGDSIYCHHNNSVLSGTGTSTEGRYHDAFSLYLNLECGGDMKSALNWNEAATKANQIAWRKAQDEALPKVEINLTAISENLRKRQMPDTQKPTQLKTDSARCLVELHELDGLQNRLIQSSIVNAS
jgi:hypothetical protein